MLVKIAFITCALLTFAGCSPPAPSAESTVDDIQLGPSKARWSFELPSEGTPNDNGPVGPFCCTGVTAVVTDGGHDVGFGYFFGWKGQAFGDNEQSWMPDVEISVAGAEDLQNPISSMPQSVIAFDAKNISPGSTKSEQAGALLFTVTVERVDLSEMFLHDGTSEPVIDMGTFAVRLDVDPVD